MDNAFWIEFLPLGQAIGWTILNSLWQIALLAGIWRLFLWSIPQNQPNLRYGFTLSCLVLATAWSGWTFSNEWSNAKALSVDQQLVTSSTPVSNVSISVAQVPNDHVASSAIILEEIGNHPTTKEQNFTPLITNHFLYEKVTSFSRQFIPIIPYLAIVWYIGVLLMSCLIIGGFFHLNQLKKTGVQLPSTEWLHRFDHLKKQMGITHDLQFLWSKKVVEPLTFYFFKPVVLAPIGLMTSLPQDQIEVLLLHELAHIRRYDFSVNIFQSLIEVLFFYHPAVWWMSSELRKEREHCCDDLVMSVHNNPLAYAEALTCLQSPNFSLKTSLAMAATGKKGSFSQRIFRLFGKYDRQPVTLKGTFLILILLLTGFLTQGFKHHVDPQSAVADKTMVLDNKVHPSDLEDMPKPILTPATSLSTLEADESVNNTTLPQLEAWNIDNLPNLMSKKWSNGKNNISNLTITTRLQENAIAAHFAKLKAHFIGHSTDDAATLDNKNVEVSEKVDPVFNQQEAILNDGERVYIDWTNPDNNQHINAARFKKWSDKKIRKLYKDNLKAKELFDKNKLATEGTIRDQREYDPLTYTIDDGHSTRTVTLDTYVNHHRKISKGVGGFFARQKGNKALKDLEKHIPFSGSLSPIKGYLPAFVKSTSVHTQNRTKHEQLGIGIHLDQAAENVTIEIKEQNGRLVETIFNNELGEGGHNFTWKFNQLESGTYQIDITVNDQTMSQLRKIKNKTSKKKKQNRYSNNCRGLLEAVKASDVTAVKELLKANSPDCSYRGSGEPRSPLVAAARQGDVAIVTLLLDAGGSVEYNVHGDESPLMAAANNGHLELVNLLIARGAKVNKEIHGDGTALIVAIRKGHYDITKTLLENGADPLLGSAVDENPFYYASKQPDGKFLDLLIEYRGK